MEGRGDPASSQELCLAMLTKYRLVVYRRATRNK